MKRFVFLFFLALSFANCEEAVFELGGNAGWEKLSYVKNISFTNGKFGLAAASLTSHNIKLEEVSDLYLSFDTATISDTAKNYSVLSSSFLQASEKNSKFGSGAALCTPQSKTPAIVLSPSKNSFFYGNEVLNSFTIEFWIRPEVSDAGSTILEWKTQLPDKGKIYYQSIIANLIQNKLEWNLIDIWQKEGRALGITLKSKSNILPEKWSHHLLSYDSGTGLLEYRLNGRIEALEFLTANRHEGSEILYAKLGLGKRLEIGKNYSGYLDEFKVKRSESKINDPSFSTKIFEKLPLEGGRFESTIIDAGGNYARVYKLLSDEYKPAQTDVLYYIRTSNERFNWTEEYPKWIEVAANCDLKNFTGRYMQVAAVLYPDGKGQKSPLVNFVKVEYESDPLPYPPTAVYAKGLDSAVELRWSPSVDFDTKGYLVYYGERSGEYFYAESPLDVGNVLNCKIEGLKNGRLYFFSVVAYDMAGANNPGNFSKEVWARPKAAVDCAKKAQ